MIDPKNFKSEIGNYLYSAPELQPDADGEMKITGEKVDIFSAGIILYYLVSGSLPFGDDLCDKTNEQYDRL